MNDPENNTHTDTSVTVSGTLTVCVHLAGSERRYNSPDLKTEIPVQFGGKAAQIEEMVKIRMEQLQRRILIAAGKEAIK